ncbi:hypothetical protein BH23ACT10_BH23ACT10_32750 [soil metagenome]
MGRKRAFYPIDTSDGLANVVVSTIAILIVALLALILWMTGSDDPATLAAAGQTDVVDELGGDEPDRVPADDVAGADGTADTAPDGTADTAPDGTDGAERDGGTTDGAPTEDQRDPDTATDDQPDTVEPPARAPDGDAPTVAGTDQGDAAGAPDDAGPARDNDAGPADPAPAKDALPNPGRGSGLFSRDDPGRVPAITVSSSPRDEMTVAADFDGGGENERVWSAIVRDQVTTRLERVVDGRWEPGRDHGSAPADRLVDLRAQDLTGDGLPEVYTKQWVATEGESVTLWSVEDGDLVRMPVHGGCWADNNTVGIIGARVQVPADGSASVVAICKEKPRPTQQWSSALYRWQRGQWTFDRNLGTFD